MSELSYLERCTTFDKLRVGQTFYRRGRRYEGHFIKAQDEPGTALFRPSGRYVGFDNDDEVVIAKGDDDE